MVAQRRRARQAAQRASLPAPAVAPPASPAPLPAPAGPQVAPPAPKTIIDGRPTAAHPWKRHTRLPRSGAPPLQDAKGHRHRTLTLTERSGVWYDGTQGGSL
jgi:hypothetical protein